MKKITIILNLIEVLSFSNFETNWNFSISQKLTVLSLPQLANKNSWGWNFTHVTGDVCSTNSCKTFPTRTSHTFTSPENEIHLYILLKFMQLVQYYANFLLCCSKLIMKSPRKKLRSSLYSPLYPRSSINFM